MTDATLVDTSVLLDLLTADPISGEWSQAQLDIPGSRGRLLINDIIHAETSVRFENVEDLDLFLADTAVEREAMPGVALFLAGKAHRRYRQGGGTRRGVLSDFFIGAHAAVGGVPLLTRDPSRVRGYFPTVRIISPTVT